MCRHMARKETCLPPQVQCKCGLSLLCIFLTKLNKCLCVICNSCLIIQLFHLGYFEGKFWLIYFEHDISFRFIKGK